MESKVIETLKYKTANITADLQERLQYYREQVTNQAEKYKELGSNKLDNIIEEVKYSDFVQNMLESQSELKYKSEQLINQGQNKLSAIQDKLLDKFSEQSRNLSYSLGEFYAENIHTHIIQSKEQYEALMQKIIHQIENLVSKLEVPKFR